MDMLTGSFSSTLFVPQSPAAVFNAIMNVAAWWTENFTGRSAAQGDEFEVRFGDMHYSKQKLTEVVPGRKIVWLVTGSCLSFLQDKTEWTGTSIVFDIAEKNGHSLLTFTHVGLVPAIECYGACSTAWGKYLQYSLLSLLAKGAGQPGFPPNGPLVLQENEE